MYSWLLPAVKAILPHVGDIVNAALPVFKRQKVEPTSSPGPGAMAPEGSLQQQIIELQGVASQNAIHIKDLAAQLQQMIVTLEQGARESERRYKRLTVLAWLAFGTSALAIILQFAR